MCVIQSDRQFTLNPTTTQRKLQHTILLILMTQSNSFIFLVFVNIIVYPSYTQAFHRHFTSHYKATFGRFSLTYKENNKTSEQISESYLSSKNSNENDNKDDDDNYNIKDGNGINEAFNALDQISNIDLDLDDDDTTDYYFRDRLNRAISESDDITTVDFIDEATLSRETNKETDSYNKGNGEEEEDQICIDMKIELDNEECVYLDVLAELSSDSNTEKRTKKDELDDIEKMINGASLMDNMDGIGSEDEDNKSDEEDMCYDIIF